MQKDATLDRNGRVVRELYMKVDDSVSIGWCRRRLGREKGEAWRRRMAKEERQRG